MNRACSRRRFGLRAALLLGAAALLPCEHARASDCVIADTEWLELSLVNVRLAGVEVYEAAHGPRGSTASMSADEKGGWSRATPAP